MMPNIPSNVKYDISIHKPANCATAVTKEQLEFIFLNSKVEPTAHSLQDSML